MRAALDKGKAWRGEINLDGVHLSGIPEKFSLEAKFKSRFLLPRPGYCITEDSDRHVPVSLASTIHQGSSSAIVSTSCF